MTEISSQAGQVEYQLVPEWEQRPEDRRHRDVAAVAVDRRDRVFVLTRHDPQVIIYEPDGTYVGGWGEEIFTNRAHGITIGPNDTVYCIDDSVPVVRQFTAEGHLLLEIGDPTTPSDTGYDGSDLRSIKRGAGPFNCPTNIALAPNGDLYVSDGYGNARVHHFTAGGEHVHSWGEPGIGPGQFNLPHGVIVTRDERVLVADRENDRVQIFSPSGDFIGEWDSIHRPTQLAVYDDYVYVSELWWEPGRESLRLGTEEQGRPSRVSILDPADGTVVGRVGGTEPDGSMPGQFFAAHDLAVDSRGDLYVAEVSYTFGGARGLAPEDCHDFQKFTRI
jgi:DNA-binding beta-propeller fold protein YncE